MKIRIELESDVNEPEIVIVCNEITDEVQKIQRLISSQSLSDDKFVLYKDEGEYYIPIARILFFETEGNTISVHTKDDVYETKYRLYELEEMLPGHFIRVSKSTIVNAKEILALKKSNLSTTSVAAFADSYKEVYVSRHYIKFLKEKLESLRGR